MSEEDKKLIAEAETKAPQEFALVWQLEERAESEEAKRVLHDISTRLYHSEEYSCGIL